MSSKMVRMKTNPERGRLLKRSMPTAVTVITDRNYEKPLKKRSLFRVEEKNKWWTERFNEDKGDSSKVLEITISDDDDDDFQCTFHYGTGKPVVEPAAKPADDLFKQKQDCKPSQYLCVFCSELSADAESAKEHYLAHLGLLLECRECHQRFPDIHSFRKHNSEHMAGTKMINLDEFLVAKKWVDHYIDNCVGQPKELSKSLMFTFQMYCPICFRIRAMYELNDLRTEKIDVYLKKCKIKFTEEFVRNHLYEHFQYFPYECIDCELEDKKTEFCLNDKARQHLLEVHGIENAFKMNLKELKSFYNRRKPIKRLEICIEKCLMSCEISKSLFHKMSSKLNKSQIQKRGS